MEIIRLRCQPSCTTLTYPYVRSVNDKTYYLHQAKLWNANTISLKFCLTPTPLLLLSAHQTQTILTRCSLKRCKTMNRVRTYSLGFKRRGINPNSNKIWQFQSGNQIIIKFERTKEMGSGGLG